MEFLPDGSKVLAKRKGDHLMLFDPRTGKMARELAYPRNKQDISSTTHDICASSDGSLAIAITFSRLIAWDTATGAVKFERFADDAEFSALSSTFDGGKQFATGDNKGNIQIWDVNQKNAVKSLALLGGKSIDSVAVSADGSYLAAMSMAGGMIRDLKSMLGDCRDSRFGTRRGFSANDVHTRNHTAGISG